MTRFLTYVLIDENYSVAPMSDHFLDLRWPCASRRCEFSDVRSLQSSRTGPLTPFASMQIGLAVGLGIGVSQRRHQGVALSFTGQNDTYAAMLEDGIYQVRRDRILPPAAASLHLTILFAP